MRNLTSSLVVTLCVFLVGATVGASLVLYSLSVREFVVDIFRVRMFSPMQAASAYGVGVMSLLVFVNNSVPPILSFVYPLAIVGIHWTPPLSHYRQRNLMRSFTLIVAFLVGFFGLGAGLAMGWVIGGSQGVLSLLARAWLHGPLEFALILLCVSEPLRLAELDNRLKIMLQLKKDVRILSACLIGLLLSSLIEVLLMI